MELLVRRDWSENNIRELRNTVELAADFAQGSVIDGPLLEKIMQIQKGSVGDRPPSEPSAPPTRSPGSLVQIRRDQFREILESREGASTESKPSKIDAPFYQLQLEFSARVILEGLRHCGWKLRPTAKKLGISPTKLRGELKEFIKSILLRYQGEADLAAENLDIPRNILEKKAKALGLGDLLVTEEEP